MGGMVSGESRLESAVLEDVARPSAAVRLLVTGDETSGRLAMVETTVARGTEQPTHVHQNEDVIVYVLAGEVAFYLDGERHACRTGESLVLPIGQEHSYTVESAEAKLLLLVTPAGLEGIYEELCGPESSNLTSVERLVTTAARYGISITGPAPDRADQPGCSTLDLPIP